MKFLLLAIIKLYWISIPTRRRRSCLFKETCSQFVYRHTEEYGFFEGFRALLHRNKKCRSGYKLYSTNHGFEMELADGSIIKENEISTNILSQVFHEIQSLTRHLEEESKNHDLNEIAP